MILPPATLGVLGGGQLGLYFVLAAQRLGYRVVVFDPDPQSVAGRIADEHIVADYDDTPALNRLAVACTAVTTEFESVPAAALRHLARFVPVLPGADAVAICQHRDAEKRFLSQHGFPCAPYAEIRCADDIAGTDDRLFPGILKVLRFGYDGKGQITVNDRAQALTAWQQLKHEPCVLEQRLRLEAELSVVLTRSQQGHIECYPPAQNRHKAGVLDVSMVPALDVPQPLLDAATAIARDIAEHLDYVGTMAVEFFVVGGQLYVNELAPRPHNSGHYTLDACITSQFEQQVRALCGLPLAEARTHSAAVMVNLLGDLWFSGDDTQACEPEWHKFLPLANLKLHLYGKAQPRRGRKMGHFTVLGDDPAAVFEMAMAARTAIGISAEPS